ncbi:MAG: hypothetical protein QME85_10015 [Candidatus Saccharicenans sp.]|nr:hypothetical protein [Candidatus Saccharicenans sp.]MDI6849609.1 hypothetical protein [Candidatus Saccharicenans sp.]
MIDCLLPARICRTREKLKRLTVCLQKSSPSARPQSGSGMQEEESANLCGALDFLPESFRIGMKKSAELLWLVEELAAGFPETALRVVVWLTLISPVLKESGLGQDQAGPNFNGRAATGKPFPDCNHLFMPPPAGKALKLLEAGPAGISPGKVFPVFDLPAARRVLLPAALPAPERSEPGVAYYLLHNESFGSGHHPVGKRYFPFRPRGCRNEATDIADLNPKPILTLTGEQFKARLGAYFLLLGALFSGWARFGWRELVLSRQGSGWRPELDAEIAFLATEIGRLQLGLFHLSRGRSFGGEFYSRKVEKLCLKGLHLASRAWKYAVSRVRE